MNKEELLERLRELQTQLGASSIVEEQVKILDEHYEIKSGIEAEINQLLVKTSNDKNYTKTKDTASNVSRLERENSQIDVNLANLEAEIARVGYQQSNIDSEIEAAEQLIIAGRGEIDEINLALEQSLEDDQIAKLNAQRVATEQAISSLEHSIERLNREKEVANKTLNELEERKTTSEIQKTTYEAMLEEAKGVQPETYVDELERSKDRERLAELRKTLRSLSTKSELLSFDISGELSDIIAGVENDTFTPEQTRVRIQELYDNIPMELFAGDYTNREDAIRENHEAQSLYVGKIAALEDKLSNDDNYRLSVFEIERNEIDSEKEKVRISALLAASVATIKALEHELKNNQINLSIQDNYDKKKQREFRALGEDVDPKIDAKYSKVFEKCREKKNRLYEQQESIKDRLHEARINKNALEKELESLEIVDDRTIMNTAAKKADEAKLEKYRANLEHLKKTEQLAAYDPQESLLAIIAGLEKEQELVAPIVAPVVEEKQEEKEDEKVIIAPIAAEFKEADEELVEKSRDKKKGLIAWFKKHKNRLIAAGVATAIFFTAIGLKSCDNKTDDLPDEPTIEENQDEERPSIDDLVSSTIENDKGDDEVNKAPEVTPDPEPTPDPVPTPDPEPTPETTTTEIVVNEGETLVFEDNNDQTVKVDLSEGQNDNVLPDVEMVGPEQSDSVAGLEYNYGENGEDMSATVTVETETNEMTDEQFENWLQSQREANGFDNEVYEELLGRHR